MLRILETVKPNVRVLVYSLSGGGLVFIVGDFHVFSQNREENREASWFSFIESLIP